MGAKSSDPKRRRGYWSILKKEAIEKLILSSSEWDRVSRINLVFLVDQALPEIRNMGVDYRR